MTMSPALSYTPGAIGCALSHLELWERCGAGSEPMTICEDDAVLHSAFEPRAAELLGNLAQGWHLVLWGWNFDSVMQYEMLEGVPVVIAGADEAAMRRGARVFQQTARQFELRRLRRAIGAVAYTISPEGARRLRTEALPLRPLAIKFPLFNDPFPNSGIDMVMNYCYDELNAFVCVPPLALAMNEKAKTTVQRPG